MEHKTALIAGVTGIAGSNLAAHLAGKSDWTVYGLARKPGESRREETGERRENEPIESAWQNVHPVAADLLNFNSLQRALKEVAPTHVFITTWMRQPTEAENIRINSLMVKNLLEALAPSRSIQHVALVTGLKHYLGPFEAYGKGNLPATPFREDGERLDVENFYYAQEDELFAAAAKDGFTWSVHRPHTIIGYALGNAMNMGLTLATYAVICRETGQPFVFPGSAVQWNGLTDVTDARILARHLEWAATTPAASNQALNIVNGDVFRWSWMWGRIAKFFNIEPQLFSGTVTPLQDHLADAAPIWADVARKHSLAEPDLNVLASAWHTDADLGRPIEVLTDMGKSRKLGFLDYQATDDSFFDLFQRLRQMHIIP